MFNSKEDQLEWLEDVVRTLEELDQYDKENKLKNFNFEELILTIQEEFIYDLEADIGEQKDNEE